MLTREESKQKLSDRGRRGAEAKWAAYHAATPKPNYGEIPDPCIEIKVTNHASGKITTLVFHPGTRRGRYIIDIDGKFWRECGWSKATVKIRKSCKRTPLYVN